MQEMQLDNRKQRKQITLRLPPNLYKQIEVEAKRQSVKASVLMLLQFHYLIIMFLSINGSMMTLKGFNMFDD